MDLLVYENFKVTFADPVSFLSVKEFRDVWDSDKTKNKEYTWKVFLYIFLMCSYKSPYRNFLLKDKLEAAKKSSGLTDKEIDLESVKTAMTVYKKILHSNPKLAVIEDIMASINNFREYFKTVNFIEKVESGAKKGEMLYSPKDYLSVVEKTKTIFEQIDYLQKTLAEELEKKTDVRGDQEKGYFNE